MNNTQPNNIYPIFDRMLGREAIRCTFDLISILLKHILE